MDFPLDIISKIKEFCCIKKSNNIDSRDFLIIIKTGFSIEEQTKNEIILWLIQIIQKLLNDINEEQADLIYELYNGDSESNKEIRILIHFSKQHYLYSFDSDNIICIHEYPNENLIKPQIILNHLINEYKYINKIGISGISEQLIKDLWWQLIDGENGYMKNSSYCITQDGYFECREKSFNFGWQNYPP